ncbi:MAG: hypothetical protein IJZ46_02035 [Bacilli bacterium]|nr:hypothetical protein [Bacilli bacterium]
MEENNRKGPGVFYAVVGVATLVVAIIGATFAYFSAATDANTEIGGETATVEALTLDVEPIVVPKKGEDQQGLVPLNENAVLNAVKGGCVDSNGNAACHVYRITISNPGSATVASQGTLALAAAADSAFTNLKWALVNGLADTATDATGATGVGTTNGMSATEIGTPTLYPVGDAQDRDVEVYYVVVWINNKTTNQSSEDYGSFVGTVTWAGIDGEVKIQSTFSAS